MQWFHKVLKPGLLHLVASQKPGHHTNSLFKGWATVRLALRMRVQPLAERVSSSTFAHYSTCCVKAWCATASHVGGADGCLLNSATKHAVYSIEL